MIKVPASWSRNPDKVGGIAYSDPTVQYSSATTAYSTPDAAEAESGKLPDSWAFEAKNPTVFSFNPAAQTNLRPYDSALYTYDSAVQTYDGIVTGEDFSDQKTPAIWSPA